MICMGLSERDFDHEFSFFEADFGYKSMRLVDGKLVMFDKLAREPALRGLAS